MTVRPLPPGQPGQPREDPCTVRVVLSVEAVGYLRQLVATGMWGDSPEEVVRGLVLAGLRSRLDEGWCS